MKARIIVTLRESVLDPQGQAIQNALLGLGFSGINQVRQGKVFDIDMDALPPQDVKQKLSQMCENVLANGVIEDYHIDIL